VTEFAAQDVAWLLTLSIEQDSIDSIPQGLFDCPSTARAACPKETIWDASEGETSMGRLDDPRGFSRFYWIFEMPIQRAI